MNREARRGLRSRFTPLENETRKSNLTRSERSSFCLPNRSPTTHVRRHLSRNESRPESSASLVGKLNGVIEGGSCAREESANGEGVGGSRAGSIADHAS